MVGRERRSRKSGSDGEIGQNCAGVWGGEGDGQGGGVVQGEGMKDAVDIGEDGGGLDGGEGNSRGRGCDKEDDDRGGAG